MSSDSAKFLKAVVICVVTTLHILLLMNYLLDAYDVFHHRILPNYGQLQERFLKVEYLKQRL